MKNEKLNEAFGMIKDEYIEHAHAPRKFKLNWQWKTALRVVIGGAFVVALVIVNANRFGSKNESDRIETYSKEYYLTNGSEDYSADNNILNENVVSSADKKSSSLSETETDKQKLIVTGYLNLRIDDFDNTVKNVVNLVEQYDGYFASMNDYVDAYGSYSTHYFKATVRVPHDYFNKFVDEVKAQGGVLSYSENSDDITTAYTDLSARLEVLKAEKERVLSYFEKAENVSELIEVEKRLGELQQEIESIQAQLKNYDTVVDYSTLYLTMSNSTYEQTSPMSFTERLVESFKDGWDNFTAAIGELILSIVFNIWWLVILAGAVCAAVTMIKKKTDLKKNPESMQGEVSKKEKKDE